MMDGRAGHGHGLPRGGIFVEFLDGVGRPSGRSPIGVDRRLASREESAEF
jgi:hypothetical protein